tara:strand:- start:228 stop:983 length:756 start_codon:yes stop_codon:yes gene_type:complete
MAHAFADHTERPIHIFNASSKATRGIEFIETDVSPIARSGIDAIILLDEADQITKPAQMALKGVLENCSCIFILTCNNMTGLIEPLVSRCQAFAFEPITDAASKVALLKIIDDEDVYTSSVGVLDTIIATNRGDLRSMVNALQAYVTTFRSSGERAALAFIENMAGNFTTKKFIQHINDKDFTAALKYLEKADDIRTTLNIIMQFTISKGANLAIIGHVVTAYRDLQFGMPEPIVRAGFCRNMVQSAPLLV